MIRITSEASMRAFGAKVGGLLNGGEIIELIGDVGAGKTTFVKGMAQGLDISEDIQSPSFTISRLYDAHDSLQLAHYDFYRLNDAGIMADELSEAIGLDDTIVVIEWAGIIETILPPEHLTIRIDAVSETERSIEVLGEGERYLQLMGEIQ